MATVDVAAASVNDVQFGVWQFCARVGFPGRRLLCPDIAADVAQHAQTAVVFMPRRRLRLGEEAAMAQTDVADAVGGADAAAIEAHFASSVALCTVADAPLSCLSYTVCSVTSLLFPLMLCNLPVACLWCAAYRPAFDRLVASMRQFNTISRNVKLCLVEGPDYDCRGNSCAVVPLAQRCNRMCAVILEPSKEFLVQQHYIQQHVMQGQPPPPTLRMSAANAVAAAAGSPPDAAAADAAAAAAAESQADLGAGQLGHRREPSQHRSYIFHLRQPAQMPGGAAAVPLYAAALSMTVKPSTDDLSEPGAAPPAAASDEPAPAVASAELV